MKEKIKKLKKVERGGCIKSNIKTKKRVLENDSMNNKYVKTTLFSSMYVKRSPKGGEFRWGGEIE